jgi:hypothetical protein
MAMKIRVIGQDDRDAVVALLCEGFQRRDRAYWVRALHHLDQRPEVAGYPKYGFLIEDQGAVQGVLLILTADLGAGFAGGLRSNLSSWYVREPWRKYATFMLRAALKVQGGCYTDLSPAPQVVQINAALGFRPYTGGSILLDARSAFRGGGTVAFWDGVAETGLSAGLDSTLKAVARRHIGYGCTALVLSGPAGPEVALYRIKKLKRVIPAARFVYGDPALLIDSAGAVMRALLGRGVPLAQIDAPLGFSPAAGSLMPTRDLRYATGGVPPLAGDLLETEIAVFGP